MVKYVFSGQRSRSILHFVFNRVMSAIFFLLPLYCHLIMASQMLVIRNTREGRRVPLLDAWLLAGRGHWSVGLYVSRRMFFQCYFCSHYYHAEEGAPAPSSISCTFCSLSSLCYTNSAVTNQLHIDL